MQEPESTGHVLLAAGPRAPTGPKRNPFARKSSNSAGNENDTRRRMDLNLALDSQKMDLADSFEVYELTNCLCLEAVCSRDFVLFGFVA